MNPTFLCRCVGVRHRGKPVMDYVAAKLFSGAEVRLEREPLNRYDDNAIKVLHEGEWIGYVDRDSAAEIAPHLDADTRYTAFVVGWDSPIDPRLRVEFFQEKEAA